MRYKKFVMNKIYDASRMLLGLTLFVFGLNGFFHFYALPETTEASMRFQQALWDSNYLMYLVKAIEVTCGLLLLINRYVIAALIFLAPVTINIFLVDIILQPQFMFIGTSVFILHFVLLMRERQKIKGLLH